jgi:hypothetical protein
MKSFNRVGGRHDRMELSLGRAEWSTRPLNRELRKTQ